MPGKLIVLVGNIGTGKTTFREKEFKNEEVIICPDEWEERGEQLHKKMEKLIRENLQNDRIVVIDGCNLKLSGRNLLLYWARIENAVSICYDFGIGTDETLQRRINDPRQTPSDIWQEEHIRNQTEYIKPELREGFKEVHRMY